MSRGDTSQIDDFTDRLQGRSNLFGHFGQIVGAAGIDGSAEVEGDGHAGEWGGGWRGARLTKSK